MKKFLSALGALTLIASSASTVIACGSTTVQEKTDKQKYDGTEAVKTVVEDTLYRAKSLVLSDQFQISDATYWSQIMKYNKNSDFLKTFEILDTNNDKFKEKTNLSLTGHGGESSVLVYDVVEGSFNKIKAVAKDAGLNKMLEDPLNTGEEKIIKAIRQVSGIIPGIPDLLAKINLDGVLSFIPAVFDFLSQTITNNKTIENFPQKLGLNIIADTMTAFAQSGAFNGGLNAMIGDMIKVTDVNTYENWTYRQVTNGLWFAILNTIGYYMNPKYYVSNPDINTELGLIENKADYEAHAIRVVSRVINSLKKSTADKIKPLKGEKQETLGVAKYAAATIKLLELKLQFFGDALFDFLPEASEGASEAGNMHLFSRDLTNAQYFKELDVKTVGKDLRDAGPKVENGINLIYFSKIVDTFLAHRDLQSHDFTDQKDGIMFQKLLNALLTGIRNDKNSSFSLPIVDDVLIHWIASKHSLAKGVVSSIVGMIQGIFNDKALPSGLPFILNIALQWIPDSDTNNVKKYLSEFVKFLTPKKAADNKTELPLDGPAEVFMDSPYTFLWNNDIALTVPSLFNKFKNTMNLDQLNLSNLIYEVKLPLLVESLTNNKVDLNKYGDKYLNNSLAQMLNMLALDLQIGDLKGEALNRDNISLESLQVVSDILLDENPIKLSDIGATDNYDQTDRKQPISESLLHQIIRNLKQPDIFIKLIGVDVKDKKMTILENGFMGQLLKMMYPHLKATGTNNSYQAEDFKKMNDTFSSRLYKTALIFLGSILEGKNYTYLIQPLVTEEKVWKIIDIDNGYFPGSGGQIHDQTIEFTFDPTGVRLNDGSVVDDTHTATYVVTMSRSTTIQKYNITEIKKITKK